MQLKIPPPVYALLTAFCMWLLNKYLPLWYWLEPPWNKIGLILMVTALLLDVWSLVLFFRRKTTPNPMKPENTSTLVTGGFYRFTRNPMYLGMLLLLSGYVIWLGSITPVLMLPLFVWVITVMQILPEERILTEKFGDEFLNYKRRVRRWI